MFCPTLYPSKCLCQVSRLERGPRLRSCRCSWRDKTKTWRSWALTWSASAKPRRSSTRSSGAKTGEFVIDQTPRITILGGNAHRQPCGCCYDVVYPVAASDSRETYNIKTANIPLVFGYTPIYEADAVFPPAYNLA